MQLSAIKRPLGDLLDHLLVWHSGLLELRHLGVPELQPLPPQEGGQRRLLLLAIVSLRLDLALGLGFGGCRIDRLLTVLRLDLGLALRLRLALGRRNA